MKTRSAKPQEVDRRWYVVDAEGKTLGRLAARVASVLLGKGKPTWTPHVDTGDFVIVVNADKVRVTGKKMTNKLYYSHSGYPGHLKVADLQRMLMKHPEKVMHMAVRGMLPGNRLGRQMLRKLKIYAGADHPHQAQNPEPLEVA